jgi:putative Mn2+ efflux pump MntP
MEDIWYGIAAILGGIYTVWSTYKETRIQQQHSNYTFQLYVGGFMLILIGVVMILKKLYQLSESYVVKSWVK